MTKGDTIMYEAKDYTEAVIKALVEKLNLTEWQLERAEEAKKMQRQQIDELTKANTALMAELEQLKAMYKEKEIEE